MDHGMRLGKRLLSAMTPLLDEFGAGGAIKPLMQGVSAYDQGRATAMDGYTQLMSHHTRIKRQVPELSLIKLVSKHDALEALLRQSTTRQGGPWLHRQ